MKVTAPLDIQGRIISCTYRAKLIADALDAFAHTDRQNPDPDSAFKHAFTGKAQTNDDDHEGV